MIYWALLKYFPYISMTWHKTRKTRKTRKTYKKSNKKSNKKPNKKPNKKSNKTRNHKKVQFGGEPVANSIGESIGNAVGESIKQNVDASKEYLAQQKVKSLQILENATAKNADQIRKTARVIAELSKDPEVQKQFAETIVKVGEAIAAVAENSGETAENIAIALGPAFRSWSLAASDLAQDLLLNAGTGAVGAVPVVGDIVATAVQEFSSVNENFMRSFWAWFKMAPHLVEVAQISSENADQALDLASSAKHQMGMLTDAINRVAEQTEKKQKAEARQQLAPQQTGGKRRARSRRIHRRKKSTKKKAPRQQH